MINSKIKTLIIFLVFLIQSCIPIKKNNLIGVYEYNGKISKGNLTLENNTFKYSYEAPLFYNESEGTWLIYKNRLYLNSFANYKSDYIEVEEKTISEGFYIKVIDGNGLQLGGVSLKLNDKLNLITNSEGKIFPNMKNNEVSKIQIFALGLSIENSIYNVKSKSSNSFIIRIIQKHETRRFFDNEKIKVKGKSIFINNLEYKFDGNGGNVSN